MSEQQTGGDGSVKWSLDADSVKEHSSTHELSGRLKHSGIDNTGYPGEPFTISIRVPSHFNNDVNAYLEELRKPGSPWGINAAPNGELRVFFNIPIERRTNDQIRVSWGSSVNVLKTPSAK
jgi:hypothetical protein